MNDVREAALKFHQDFPRATRQQAEAAADIEFSETSDQIEFVATWKKLNDQAASMRIAKFKNAVDRRWPDSKGY